VQFIQFDRFGFRGSRQGDREVIGCLRHPIDHGLMMDAEDARNAAEIQAIDIQFERLGA
jgi:hypothetical protein